MALAQQTAILLLDEPTTFLDIAHQIELLELFTDLHHVGHTLVAVLHDLNHAARYGTHLIAMKDGQLSPRAYPADRDRRAGRGGLRLALSGGARSGGRHSAGGAAGPDRHG